VWWAEKVDEEREDLESTIDDFKRYRDLVPLIPYIVGVTPRVLDDRVWQKRGEEIEDYLNKHTEVENYCIIDDDSDMLEEQLSHFLRTNYHEGLTKDHIVLIKNILNLWDIHFVTEKKKN
jgi:hypothetical protein